MPSSLPHRHPRWLAVCLHRQKRAAPNCFASPVRRWRARGLSLPPVGSALVLIALVGPVDASTQVAAAPVSSFSPLITRAMGDLAHLRLTSVPLEAPAGSLASVLQGFPLNRAAGAWFEATTSSYEVHIGLCTDLYPPASAHIAVAARCTGDTVDMVAGFSFGAKAYTNNANAVSSLRLPAPRGTATPIELGYNIVAARYSLGGGLVDWSLGKWDFRVDYSACPTAARNFTLATAKGMVAVVHAHPLPSGPGTALLAGACGDPTSGGATITWAHGPDVYSALTAGYAYMPPLLLAAEMRPYP
jgi:hypothetical protein